MLVFYYSIKKGIVANKNSVWPLSPKQITDAIMENITTYYFYNKINNKKILKIVYLGIFCRKIQFRCGKG